MESGITLPTGEFLARGGRDPRDRHTAALAAKAATATIPIIFVVASDRLGRKFQPAGHRFQLDAPEVSTKRLGLLHDLLPGAARFAVLVDPNATAADSVTKCKRRQPPSGSRSNCSR
jgi:putative ABC transport system substrate-binding protein